MVNPLLMKLLGLSCCIDSDALLQENGWTVRHITELEMTCASHSIFFSMEVDLKLLS